MKKFVYFAALAASICLSLASCSQDEPIAQKGNSTSPTSEIATRGSDGYDPFGSLIRKYGVFLTDLSGIQDQKTLLALKNGMWDRNYRFDEDGLWYDPKVEFINHFKTVNEVNDANFLLVGKRDALIQKSTVKAFYDKDKPIVVLEPGSKADFEWWLGEMEDPTMKFNVNANAQVAYLSSKGKPIAVIFTKNRAIVIDEDESHNPRENARYIFENLKVFNTHATVKVLKYPVVANDPACQIFVNSLSGIDPNPDFSNFLVIGQQEAQDNKQLVEKFYSENKPIVLIGPDMAHWRRSDFRSWAHSIGGSVANVADSVPFMGYLGEYELAGFVFDKHLVWGVIDEPKWNPARAPEDTSAGIWGLLETWF